MRIASATGNSQLFEVASKIGMGDIKFLIDNHSQTIHTWTIITILPQRIAVGLNLNPTPVKLSAENGREIEYFGEAVIDIGIPGPRRSYTWTVVVADSVNPA